jgi:hypothetical protein
VAKNEIAGKSTERVSRKQGKETVTQTLIAVEFGDHFWTSLQVGLFAKEQSRCGRLPSPIQNAVKQ